MVKTLRITSVVAALMAIAFFALPVKYGVRKDEKIEKFLNAPGVIETFKAASGNIKKTTINQVPPLVQQAEVYAKIIKPPPPPSPPPSTRGNGTGRVVIETPKNVTPKFTLKSTSFCSQNPSLSLALIDEPGKGTSWVGQGSTVNHLLIEEVKDGIVIVRNGDETFTLKTKELEFPKAVISRVSRPSPRGGASNNSGRITSSRGGSPETSDSAAEALRTKRVQELFDQIKLLNDANDDSDNPVPTKEERIARIQKLFTEFQNSNIEISDEEAKKLADYGQMLNEIQSAGSEK